MDNIFGVLKRNKTNNWNKKGELEVFLSAWWFFVIFLIAGGIVISISIFYAVDLDIKWLEADILGERILDCLVNNGNLIDEALNEDQFYRQCNLKKDKFVKRSEYFFKIWLDNQLIIGGGDYSIEKNCEIKKNLIYTTKSFPICSEKKINILDNNGDSKTLRILAGSNQKGRIEPPI